MALCTEQVVTTVLVDGVVNIEQEKEILDCLGEEETFLTILKAFFMNIMNCSVTTSRNSYKIGRSETSFLINFTLLLCDY